MKKEIILLAVAGIVTFASVYIVRSRPPQPPVTFPTRAFENWPGATDTRVSIEFFPDNFFEWMENGTIRIVISNGSDNEMILLGGGLQLVNENNGFFSSPLLRKPPPIPPGYNLVIYRMGGIVGDASENGLMPGAIPDALPGLWRVDVFFETNIENLQASSRFYIAGPS